MAIIFNEEGLNDIQPPCVAQTFHNHNAVLYKVFAIGETHHIVERPSIKNFSSMGKIKKLWLVYGSKDHCLSWKKSDPVPVSVRIINLYFFFLQTNQPFSLIPMMCQSRTVQIISQR